MVNVSWTEVKAAKPGRLCDYRAEETEVSSVMTETGHMKNALNVFGCKPEENNVPSTFMSNAPRYRTENCLVLTFPGSDRSPSGKRDIR